MDYKSVMDLRDLAVAGRPVELEQAFDDPSAVVRLLREAKPYELTAKVHNFSEKFYEATGPWFRRLWARQGKLLDADAAEIFHHPPFIDASKAYFAANVVSPWEVFCNINCPSPSGSAHVDMPTFMVGGDLQPPDWLKVSMGYSGLFKPWAVHVSAALTWFYRGAGGQLEYWPNGLDAGSRKSTPVLWNTALVSDNDYMYHRVLEHGPVSRRPRPLPHDATIAWTAADRWQVNGGGKVLYEYDETEVRVSILWRALTFEDTNRAAIFFERKSDLVIDRIIEMLTTDLRKRGRVVAPPSNLDEEGPWRVAVESTYWGLVREMRSRI